MASDSLSQLCSDIIEESWGGLSMRKPSIHGGVSPPQESSNKISYGPGVKIGTPELNMALQSQSSGNNPYEQEEAETLDKGLVCKYIESELSKLDSKSQLDRSAILALSRLQKNIRNCN